MGRELFDFSGRTAYIDPWLDDRLDCSCAGSQDDAGADGDVVFDRGANADKNEIADFASA